MEKSGIKLNSTNGEIDIRVNFETLSGNLQDRLNEDAIFSLPMCDHRHVFGVIDGASSQKQIEALELFGTNGAFYISHLISMGFPGSRAHKELRSRQNINGKDIVIAINRWLFNMMRNIDGVDYGDVLSIPGAAATFAIIDGYKKTVSIGHVADTVAAAEYFNESDTCIKILTGNQNQKYDDETMELALRLAKSHDMTLREIYENPETKSFIGNQLRNSFRKKINAPNGCGILNGMPELENNGLIELKEIELDENLKSLTIYSDGAILPYCNLPRTTAILELLNSGYVNSRTRLQIPTGRLEKGASILEHDEDFVRIPRLKKRDDAALVEIFF